MRLTDLGITVDKVRTLQMLSSLDNIVTRYLHIWIACSSASIQLTPSAVKAQLGSLNMLKSLQKLQIRSYSLVVLEVDGEDQDRDMDWQLPDLEELQLHDLKVVKWTRVSISDFLPQLRSVVISSCPELENANWVLPLPKLESLKIQSCPKMWRVIDDSIGSHFGAFRCLRLLHLHKLNSLSSICDLAISFPSLEHIEILRCDELKQLPVKIIGRNLREIWGSEGWWQSLQWQDENVKASLLPHFRRLN
ncbi:putative disease resistance protein At4g10780 isoform X1 [Elaeis guineensis]